MAMIFNKKYKCPVCNNNSVDKLYFSFNNYYTCDNCNSRLIFTKKSFRISSWSYFLATLFGSYSKDKIHLLVITILGGSIGMWLYLTFFGELVEYKEVKPAFNINELLDGLRNEGSKK